VEADRARAEEVTGPPAAAGSAPPPVRAAEHLAAAPRVEGLPAPDAAVAVEVALAGRSNVGKSSLLNALCARRGLARTSATPGKTRLLHLYEVRLAAAPPDAGEHRVWLCDLPGYGYAKVSHRERAAWRPMVTRYLLGRPALGGVVALVDVRRGVGELDALLLELCADAKVPALVVATKIDKLSKADRSPALLALARDLAAAGPVAGPPIGFSATAPLGVAELWAAIRRLAARRAAPALAALCAALLLSLAAPFDGAAAGTAAPAPPHAPTTPPEGAVTVDRILAVVGEDEVVTLSEVEMELRLAILKEVSSDARKAARYSAPLTMPLGRSELKLGLDLAWKQRLLWVEAKRYKKDKAPPDEVEKDLAALHAMETRAAEWAGFERRFGATPEALYALAARNVVINAFVEERITARIKISPEDVLSYYEAHRAELPGTFEDEQDAIHATLARFEKERRLAEWITALAKKHKVRMIGDVPATP
jgi:GTP-binding protein